MLPDVAQDVFEVFIGWLYTQRVYHERPEERGNAARSDEGDSGADAEDPARSASNEDTEGDATGPHNQDETVDYSDAVTWSWSILFEIFIFAEKHDTRRLRNAAIELVQIKTLQWKPKTYDMPIPSALCFAFENLPKTSALYRFLVDLMTWEVDAPKDARFAEGLPQELLAASWQHLKLILACRACKKCINRREVLLKTCSSSTCAACSVRRKAVECKAGHAVMQDKRAP